MLLDSAQGTLHKEPWNVAGLDTLTQGILHKEPFAISRKKSTIHTWNKRENVARKIIDWNYNPVYSTRALL